MKTSLLGKASCSPGPQLKPRVETAVSTGVSWTHLDFSAEAKAKNKANSLGKCISWRIPQSPQPSDTPKSTAKGQFVLGRFESWTGLGGGTHLFSSGDGWVLLVEKCPSILSVRGFIWPHIQLLYCCVLLLQSEQDVCFQEGANLQPAAGGRRT